MGAAISQAAGFYQAYQAMRPSPPPVVATIGDSTFFHAGVPALIDAVVQQVRFVLVILDNRTTAMTGNQPTPASGVEGWVAKRCAPVAIEPLVKRAAGSAFVARRTPMTFKDFIKLW